MAETWVDRWATIRSRWQTCEVECWRGHEAADDKGNQVVRFRAAKCKDAIEALACELWALRDWLINDITSGLSEPTVDAFLDSPDGYHVRACGDLATRLKHFRVDDSKKHLLELARIDEVKDGVPMIFRAVRVFQHRAAVRGGKREATGSTDEYQDAVEMVRRGLKAWETFLVTHRLIAPENQSH